MQHLFSGEAEIHHNLMTLRDNARTKDQVVAEYDSFITAFIKYTTVNIIN